MAAVVGSLSETIHVSLTYGGLLAWPLTMVTKYSVSDTFNIKIPFDKSP